MNLNHRENMEFDGSDSRRVLLRRALLLGIITVLYNIAEGTVSLAFGVQDDTIALFGFGVDSFVEVISGVGIVHLIARMRRDGDESADRFERTALRVTGAAFYLLAAGLVAGGIIAAVYGSRPATTVPGVIISFISIVTMWWLYRAKLAVGTSLGSAPVIADARCTLTCFYLSFVLLGASVLYELLGIAWIDVIGGLGIAWFAFREGREAFSKAAAGTHVCSCGDGGTSCGAG